LLKIRKEKIQTDTGLHAHTVSSSAEINVMYRILFPAALLLLISCAQTNNSQHNEAAKLNELAEKYVRLGLAIGQYDESFVDAYYGPDSLKPATTKADSIFPKDRFLAEVSTLANELKMLEGNTNDTIARRSAWIVSQLKAFERRIKLFGGDSATFEIETKELYGVSVPVYDTTHFKAAANKLDSLLPGTGLVNDRFQQLANRFIIPKTKLDTVLKTSIAECRKRTLKYYALPATENFSLEFVTNKPWSGYNWYKGNYRSIIQINTDLDIFIDRVIDVGSHESYPGHHVYNMLLEKNLYRDKGWVEISFYPLYSPQSLIAEGSANYGIELAFPGDEKIDFAKNVLLPLAGVDTTHITLYFKALALKDELNFVRNEVCRGLMNKTMTETEAVYWLKNFSMMNEAAAVKSIGFIKANRSYVINYNYGKRLAKQYIEKKAGESVDKRWDAFGWLLSNEVEPSALQ
jgi:hypothetical protein